MNHGPDDRWIAPRTEQVRRSAFFLCAEFVGAVDHFADPDDETAGAFLAPYLATIRECLVTNEASWIGERSSAVYGAFHQSANDAVGAAEEMQQAVADLRSADRTFPVSLRIGLALSEVWFDGPTMLWTERPIALAANVCARARPDQILATGSFAELIGDRSLDLRVTGRFDSPLLPVPVQTVEVLWGNVDDASGGWPAAIPAQLSARSKPGEIDRQCLDELRQAWHRCESDVAVDGRQIVGGTSDQRLETVAGLATEVHRSGAVVAYTAVKPEDTDPLGLLATSFRSWVAGQHIDTLSNLLGDEIHRVMDWIPELRERLPIRPRLVSAVSDIDVLAHLVDGVARSGPILWVVDGAIDAVDDLTDAMMQVRTRLKDSGAAALVVELVDDSLGSGHMGDGTIRLQQSPPSNGFDTPLRESGHWKGLDCYSDADSEIFFGREPALGELLGLLERSRVAALVGDPSTGKTSLLNAGVIPALRSGMLRGSADWAVLNLTCGSDPLASLATAMADHPNVEGDDVPTALQRLAKAHGQLLIIVDQFEDIFTRADARDRTAFLDLLVKLVAHPGGRVRLLIAVRSDLYGRCADNELLGPGFEHNLVLLRSLNASALEQIVTEPANAGGPIVDDAFVTRLVDVGANRRDALPLVSHLLFDLERHYGDAPFSIDLYDSVGGLDGAIEHRAEALYAASDDRRAVQATIQSLIGVDDSGGLLLRARSAAEVSDTERAVLRSFVDARLVSAASGKVALANDVVFNRWPRAKRWFDAMAERVRLETEIEDACLAWEAEDRHPSLFFSGHGLRHATRWWMDGELQLSTRAREFLRASWQAETDQQERHLQRIVELERRQTLICVALVLAILCITALVLLVNPSFTDTDEALRLIFPGSPR